MHIPPFSPSINAKIADAAKPTAEVQAANPPASSAANTVHDQAQISSEGHAALNQEKAQSPAAAPANPQAAALVLATKAAQLGRGLLHSNPEKYKQIDPDMDGKLTVAEAKSAGLMN